MINKKTTVRLAGAMLWLGWFAIFAPPASAVDYFWDTNGATAGSGNAGGVWDSGTNWSTDSTGSSATISWADGNQAVFSAGTDGVGTLAITLSGAVAPAGILVEEGIVQLNSSVNINNTGAIRIQRGTGTTRLELSGSGTTTASSVGIGNPLNIGGQTGTATLSVADTHQLNVSGSFLLGEQSGNAGTVEQTGGTVTLTGQARIGHWPSETSKYNISAGTLNSSGGFYVGWDGTGELNLSGTADVNMTGDLRIQRGSTVTIDGSATLDTKFFGLGDSRGAGNVVQNNGAVTVVGELRIGHYPTTGNYTINNGTLVVSGTGTGAESAGVITIGVDGTGVLNHAGGTITTQGLYLDSRTATSGTDQYNLTGGTLVLTSALGIKGNATTSTFQVNLGGGTIQSDASWSSTVPMTLTGTNGSVTFDTPNATGNDVSLSGALTGGGGFKKSGAGTLTLTGVGNNLGTVVLNGGATTFSGSSTSTASQILVGDTGNAAVNVSGTASVSVGDFRLGNGDGFQGTATQSGGAITVSGQFYVGYAPNETSSYTLTGGTLTLGSSGIQAGAGSQINLGGGTVAASTSWSSSAPMTLTGTNGNVSFDTNGNDITLSGVLSGFGGLNKIGAGTLSITNTGNTYTGPTNVSGGTLSLATGRLYSNAGWGNRSITISGGAVVEVQGWGDSDANSKGGFGPVAFANANLKIDNGKIRYVGSVAPAGNTDRGFQVLAGGGHVGIRRHRPVEPTAQSQFRRCRQQQWRSPHALRYG